MGLTNRHAAARQQLQRLQTKILDSIAKTPKEFQSRLVVPILMADEGTDNQVCEGQLYLGTDGCGMDWILIVTGPDRGSIWLRCGEGITPTLPKRDFLQWFEDWLDVGRDWWQPQPRAG